MTSAVEKTTESRPETRPEKATAEHPLLALRQEVDRLFDTFFSGFALGPFGSRMSPSGAGPVSRKENLFGSLAGYGEGMPRMDLSETDDALCATVEVPGMAEKDISISVENGVLTIRGEKKEEKKEEKENYHLSERRYGMIERSVRLPATADTEGVEASLEKGVLTVSVPKKAAPEKIARKVEIKTR
jgi:HSP20 family protein